MAEVYKSLSEGGAGKERIDLGQFGEGQGWIQKSSISLDSQIQKTCFGAQVRSWATAGTILNMVGAGIICIYFGLAFITILSFTPDDPVQGMGYDEKQVLVITHATSQGVAVLLGVLTLFCGVLPLLFSCLALYGINKENLCLINFWIVLQFIGVIFQFFGLLFQIFGLILEVYMKAVTKVLDPSAVTLVVSLIIWAVIIFFLSVTVKTRDEILIKKSKGRNISIKYQA